MLILRLSLETQLSAPEIAAAEQLSSSLAASVKGLRFNLPFKNDRHEKVVRNHGDPLQCGALAVKTHSFPPFLLPPATPSHRQGHAAKCFL